MGGAPGALAMGSASQLGNRRAGNAAPGARGQLEVTQAVSVAALWRCADATALLLGATRVAAAPTRNHIDDRSAASASREPPWPARWPEPSEVRDVSLPKLQQRRGDVLLEMLDAGGARDREHDGRAVEQPRERDLGGGRDQPLRDPCERAARPRQIPGGQGEPRQEGQPLALAVLEHLLGVSVP